MSGIITIGLVVALIWGTWEITKVVFSNLGSILFAMFFLYILMGAYLSG